MFVGGILASKYIFSIVLRVIKQNISSMPKTAAFLSYSRKENIIAKFQEKKAHKNLLGVCLNLFLIFFQGTNLIMELMTVHHTK